MMQARKFLLFVALRSLLLVDTLFPSAYLPSLAWISVSPYNNNNINIAAPTPRKERSFSYISSSGATTTKQSRESSAASIATTATLFASNNDEGNDDGDQQQQPENKKETQQDLKRRMDVVRSLQSSFYKPSSEGEDHPNLERETGILLNLPLWRVQWWEVPGRSNVLNVHEPIYTNMFEAVLRGPKPWCFGHLYLQGGSRNLNSKKDAFQLESWESTTTPTTSHRDQSSAAVGCLMNISDYRRMADGRLLLLVHALERFVVTDVIQSVPYGIVNAHVLPDLEEIDPNLDVSKGEMLESQLKYPRAMAIQESVRFHDYEYDRDHKLPVPNSDDLQEKDILQSDLAKVLPFAPFSKTLEPPQESSLTSRRAIGKDGEEESVDLLSDDDDDDDDDEPCLEYRLLSEGVLQTAGVSSASSSPDNVGNNNDNSREQQREEQRTHGLTTDELEYDLWLAINNFLIKTRTPVSPVLLGLLPTYDKAEDGSTDDSDETPVWPKGFVLKQIVKELHELDTVDHDFVLVPKEYPAYRRQRRLSYSAASLLETTDATNELRPRLLAAPSTRARLKLVLEGFDHWQQEQWGAFE